MKKIRQKTKFNQKQIVAIEKLALDPGIKNNALAIELKVDPATIARWRSDIDFINATYDRYMDVAGRKMTGVIEAQINEAMLGNTQAATLVLKHFGKFQDTLVLKVESPFNQFLKTKNIDKERPEDAEFEIIEEEAIQIGQSFELPKKPNKKRDPLNDKPQARTRKQNKDLNKAYKKKRINNNRNERYKWMTRAKKVGIALLGQGRPSPEKLRNWHNSIIEAEKKLSNDSNQENKKKP